MDESFMLIDRFQRRMVAAVLSLFVAAYSLAQSPALDGKAAQNGRIAQVSGVTVLELWGTPEQAGYAQGYLMAAQITALFDDYILDPKIMPTPSVYEALVPSIRRVFEWPPEILAELTALDHGARDRLGPKYRSEKLDRELTLEDLLVVNTLADLLHFGCASFSAWGPYTADGQTLTGRNLDFPYTAAMAHSQVVIVRHGQKPGDGWASIAWPGLVGAYSAMSSAGVTIALHDAPGLPLTEGTGLSPRSLTLREALLKSSPETFIKDIQSVLESRRVRVGNNIHASAVATSGRPAAAVYEYDGNPRDHGVQVRLPAGPEAASDAEKSAFLSFLGCTNHMRTRKQPTNCIRYDVIQETFARLRERSEKLDVAGAFDLLKKVRQGHTLHSVVFEPARLRMHVLLRDASAPATIDLREWLNRAPAADSTR